MDINDIAVEVEGVWLPKDEQHMRNWMVHGRKSHRENGKITYQWAKQVAAMKIASNRDPEWRRGVFVDVGAHCGFWSMWWGLECRRIIAFEPIDYLREIFRHNVPRQVNTTLLAYALGAEDGEVEIRVDPHNTGATRVMADGEEPTPDLKVFKAPLTTLDKILPPHLAGDRMSILKMDCEGFEERVVAGALKAIRKHRPVVIVEQKFANRHFQLDKTGAVAMLEKENYVTKIEIGGDYIMVPK